MSSNEKTEHFKENVKRLYDEAAAKCNTNQAWEWELKFAEQIINDVCQKMQDTDSHHGSQMTTVIKNHFGLE